MSSILPGSKLAPQLLTGLRYLSSNALSLQRASGLPTRLAEGFLPCRHGVSWHTVCKLGTTPCIQVEFIRPKEHVDTVYAHAVRASWAYCLVRSAGAGPDAGELGLAAAQGCQPWLPAQGQPLLPYHTL